MNETRDFDPTKLPGKRFAFIAPKLEGGFNTAEISIYGTITGVVDEGGKRYLSISVPSLRLFVEGRIRTLAIEGVMVGDKNLLTVVDPVGIVRGFVIPGELSLTD